MPVPGLDRPPLPSPDIQSQQGAAPTPPPGTGLGSIVAGKSGPGGPAPGAPDPNGAIVAQVEAIKKVLESMANTEPMMAPFASRATAILDSGVAAVRAAPKAPQGTGGDTGPTSPAGSPPPAPGGPGQGPPMA